MLEQKYMFKYRQQCLNHFLKKLKCTQDLKIICDGTRSPHPLRTNGRLHGHNTISPSVCVQTLQLWKRFVLIHKILKCK